MFETLTRRISEDQCLRLHRLHFEFAWNAEHCGWHGRGSADDHRLALNLLCSWPPQTLRRRTMKSSCLAEQRPVSESAAEIVGRRRQISAHWTPTERGRRLLLAAARQ